MAFKNSITANIGTAGVDVFIGASGKEIVLINFSLANILTSDVKATITIDGIHLIKDALIPSGDAFVLSGSEQKLVVTENQVINVTADTDSSIDCVISYLES